MVLETFERDSPLGPLTLVARGDQLLGLWFDADDTRLAAFYRRQLGSDVALHSTDRRDHPALRRLADYFDGEFDALSAISVELIGSAFQRSVWSALRDVPAGSTISYGQLARRIGQPRAVRAVGSANGANPIAVVVPCHRVIGSSGSLVGYGGGLERKRWLLGHEAPAARDRDAQQTLPW